MFDIITLGSATVDVFVRTARPRIIRHKEHADVCYSVGQKVLVEDLHVDTGGGGTNTAVAFSRLGLRTGWVGKVGRDLNAKTVLDEIKREGISFLGTAGKGMTGYSVILTGLERNRTILAYKGVNDQLSPNDIPWDRMTAKWLYLGSMMGRSFETLRHVAAFAKEEGIRYAFNPSMYLAQQGIRKLRQVIDGCDLLVLNREEAQALLGTEGRCVDMLPELQKYAKIAVITDGPKPAHVYNGIVHYQIIPPDIKVIEPTGAGDAFAAGFVAGLMIEKDIPAALQWAMAESCAVIQHLGAKQKLLTQKEMRQAVSKRPAKLRMERL